MLFDIYMILITGFAVFGVYCFIDMLYTLLYFLKMPKSLTVLKYSTDRYTKHKVRLMQNTLTSNEIVFLTEKKENIYENTQTVTMENLPKYIDNSLFTNG